jgi:hypothetical protein
VAGAEHGLEEGGRLGLDADDLAEVEGRRRQVSRRAAAGLAMSTIHRIASSVARTRSRKAWTRARPSGVRRNSCSLFSSTIAWRWPSWRRAWPSSRKLSARLDGAGGLADRGGQAGLAGEVGAEGQPADGELAVELGAHAVDEGALAGAAVADDEQGAAAVGASRLSREPGLEDAAAHGLEAGRGW